MLRLEQTFRYSPDGITVLTFPPGEYLEGTGAMTAEAAKEAIRAGAAVKVRERYSRKVIEGRRRKDAK